MTVFSEKLEKYAELIVKVGVNVQPEQKVVIMAPVDALHSFALFPNMLLKLVQRMSLWIGAMKN